VMLEFIAASEDITLKTGERDIVTYHYGDTDLLPCFGRVVDHYFPQKKRIWYGDEILVLTNQNSTDGVYLDYLSRGSADGDRISHLEWNIEIREIFGGFQSALS